jgi:tRNA-dihydrouridine synthase
LAQELGFDKPVINEWISNLLEVEPVNITLHGRTLKQMYTGLADWDEIAKAAELAHKTQTTIHSSTQKSTRKKCLVWLMI